MTSTSKIVQPRFCRTLSPVGRYEPARPSGARSSTIAGTPASAPIPAAQPSSALPTIPPTRIASSASGSERAGTRKAPATRTSRLSPRLLHSIPFSRPPSVRSRSGTGVMPQAGALSWIAPPFAGMTRIRFDGCDLSRAPRGTPVLRVYGPSRSAVAGRAGGGSRRDSRIDELLPRLALPQHREQHPDERRQHREHALDEHHAATGLLVGEVAQPPERRVVRVRR